MANFGPSDEIRRNGFINLGNDIFSKSEKIEFKKVCKNTYLNFDKSHHDFLPVEGGSSGYRGLPLHCPEAVKFLEKILQDKKIKNFVSSQIGDNYKIWQIDYRRSLPGDPGLEIHQDGFGQLNMAILLTENNSGDGCTIFLPGSHLIRKRVSELNLGVPPRLLKYLSFLFKPLKGMQGDISFFFNRTWHGRSRNKNEEVNEVILLALYPVGAFLSYEKPYVYWPDSFIEEIKESLLGDLLNPKTNLEKLEDGRLKVLGREETRVPFSIEIENFKGNRNLVDRLALFFITTFLKVVMVSGKLAINFVKIFKVKKGNTI